ncbi:MAG: 3-demethylubiquinone-9 3-O-methyltransferase [Spirochaetes bacterium]|nr:MAG: 3-demethylubiquinone-9 3-O-methyltransferase [Spirochaetota bacterium]
MKSDKVNNDFYDSYGDRWYTAHDDPVALLRAEGRIKNAWITETIRGKFGEEKITVLDVACGGGFLANRLAAEGHTVTGVDISHSSLAAAAARDATRSVRYLQADGYRLPFADGSFRVVCMMDFLEHVEDRQAVIREASRVLVPGGLFFFHTINRNVFAWFLIIKCVEWFVRNTPHHMHVLRLFTKPREIREMCRRSGLDVVEIRGIRPRLNADLIRIPLTGVVGEGFGFTFTPLTLFSFIGYARKRP